MKMANTDRRDLNQLIVIRILVLCGIAAFLVGSSRGNNIKTPITYHVEEELSPRLLIGNLIQDAVLTELYSAEELASLEFTFISSQEAHEELFNLTRDGTLLTRIVIDRDVLCPAEENCILSLDVEVSPVEYFQIIKINVVILDINDNRPTFQQPRIHLSLAESTPVGSLLQVPMAYDPDSPANGIDHYEVHIRDNSSRSVFGLKTNGDLQGSPGEIYLEILNYLDREEKSSYVLELTATERNVQDLKQSILIIQVSVTDVNDNMPVFTQSKYTVTVPENVHIGTALVKVMATDMDSGENSRIRYLLSSRSADNYDLMFRVDELTGEIYTQESLDYEERSQYTLIVVAVDSQVNGLTGETTVIVNVKDVNDNAPIIRITSLGKHPPKVEIPENSELMTPIAHVSIEDPDEEMGGVVSCIVNDTKFSLTQIYANDFMLRSAEILDREMTSKFYVMITCKDRGQPELVSWKTIDINVLDVNDNRPMFGQTHYQVIISADIHIGDNIFQLSATDPDEGDNGNVAYSILDPDVVHLFSINKQSGIVSANVNISNISIWDFKIHILAEDMGDEPLSSTTILILSSLVNQSSSNINLLSQNNVTVLHVEENWPENIKIGQLFDDNEHLVCDITTVVYPDEIKKLFVLSNNGEVIVQTSLDRETQETYYFGAIVKKVCRNSAGEQESVKGYIIQVIVDDQNDNAPIVIFPNSENNTITLHPGLVDERLLLAKIKGTDADVEENSRLTFTLVNPERFDYLRLNPDSGELYVIGEVRDDIESKLVRIKLTDNGSPSLSTTATLRINLTSAAVISNPETMVTADNLTKVLSITLPCSVILVLVIILIVRLTRKTFSCRTKKKDRNHVNPTTKLNLAADDPDAEKQKLSAIYTALGLHPSNGIDYLYPEKDLSACLTDIAEQLTGDKCTDLGFTQTLADQKLYQRPKATKAILTRPSPPLISSQDSDSGCSADMSHSTTTTDSWAINRLSLASNKDCPDQLRYSTQRFDDNCHANNIPVSYNYITSGPVDGIAPGLGSRTNQNCNKDFYIQANNVRKYGVINGARRALCSTMSQPEPRICLDTAGRDQRLTEDKWRRLSDPPNGAHELATTSHWKPNKPSYQDVSKPRLSNIYRSLSYSIGGFPTRNNNDIRECSTNLKQLSTQNDNYNFREEQENMSESSDNSDRRRKIIYEAQV